MKLNVGDKVKYLNTTGGGVVTRVIDSRMVLVSDQDGFEIPTMISELVRIDTSEAGARFFNESYQTPVKSEQPDEGSGKEAEDEFQVDLLDATLVRNRTTEDIFFAFVPHDQKWLITGLVDIYLVNNTSYDVIYNLLHRISGNKYSGMDYGSLFANTRHLIDTVTREDLADWTEGSLQFLFHKEHLNQVIPPFNSDFQIDGKKFHKEGAYRESPFFKAKGIIIKVVALSRYLLETLEPAEEKNPAPIYPDNEELPIIFRHQTEPRKAEVDLHIHELIEDPSNLQKSEILDFQKIYFQKRLDEAIQHDFLNIVFIHGVGNGVLRDVLVDLLKKREGIEFFDAPMVKYGVGAVEVRIPHNR